MTNIKFRKLYFSGASGFSFMLCSKEKFTQDSVFLELELLFKKQKLIFGNIGEKTSEKYFFILVIRAPKVL